MSVNFESKSISEWLDYSRRISAYLSNKLIMQPLVTNVKNCRYYFDLIELTTRGVKLSKKEEDDLIFFESDALENFFSYYCEKIPFSKLFNAIEKRELKSSNDTRKRIEHEITGPKTEVYFSILNENHDEPSYNHWLYSNFYSFNVLYCTELFSAICVGEYLNADGKINLNEVGSIQSNSYKTNNAKTKWLLSDQKYTRGFIESNVKKFHSFNDTPAVKIVNYGIDPDSVYNTLKKEEVYFYFQNGYIGREDSSKPSIISIKTYKKFQSILYIYTHKGEIHDVNSMPAIQSYCFDLNSNTITKSSFVIHYMYGLIHHRKRPAIITKPKNLKTLGSGTSYDYYFYNFLMRPSLKTHMFSNQKTIFNQLKRLQTKNKISKVKSYIE